MRDIFVTANRNHLAAYLITKDEDLVPGRPNIDLMKSFVTMRGHKRLSEKVTDAAGRFRRSGTPGEPGRAGYGEQHNLALEEKRRSTREVAGEICRLIASEQCDHWHLAAAKAFYREVSECLTEQARSKLDKTFEVDLTKVPKAEILERLGI